MWRRSWRPLDQTKRCSWPASVLQLDPSNAVAHHLRSSILCDLGSAGLAVRASRRAVELKPENSGFQASLAESIARFVMSDCPENEKHRHLPAGSAAAREAMRLDPEDIRSHAARSWMAIALGMDIEAKKYAMSALRIDPDSHIPHELLGVIAGESGDTRAASDHFVDALERNPGSAGSRRLLGNVGKAAPASVGVVGLAYTLFQLSDDLVALGPLRLILLTAALAGLGGVGYLVVKRARKYKLSTRARRWVRDDKKQERSGS